MKFNRTISPPDLLDLPRSHDEIFNLSRSFHQQWNESLIETSTSSYDPYQHITETIVYKYICLTIFIVGMIGNIFSVLVFSRSSLRHRSCAVYFLALAITDMASLCASFIDTVLPSFNNLTLTIKSIFICKLNPLMIYFTSDLSNFLLAIASIDRAVSIQYPLKAKRFCRARIAIFIIFVISILLFIINGHLFWGFEIIDESPYHACMPAKDKIVYPNGNHSLTYDRFYAIFDSLDMLFAVVIPFVIMLICNIIILVRVLTSRRSIRAIVTSTMHSRKFRKRHEKEKQLTVMLIGSAAAFLVFTLPTEINDTIRAFRPSDYPPAKGAAALITAIFIAMGQLNHAIHFYIYTLTGGIFRNELMKLFQFSSIRRTKSKSNALTNFHRRTLITKTQLDIDENARPIEDI